jgi:hypothetical protein
MGVPAVYWVAKKRGVRQDGELPERFIFQPDPCPVNVESA